MEPGNLTPPNDTNVTKNELRISHYKDALHAALRETHYKRNYIYTPKYPTSRETFFASHLNKRKKRANVTIVVYLIMVMFYLSNHLR